MTPRGRWSCADVVVTVDGDEALHEAVRQRRLGCRAAVKLQQRLPDGSLELVGQAAGGGHRLNGGGAEGADHSQAGGQPGMVAELHGQDLGVDRGRVDPATGDQPDRVLVEAGLDHAADEPRPGAEAHQGVQRDGVAGVRRRLVVGPRAAPQLLDAGDGAVAVDDHVGGGVIIAGHAFVQNLRRGRYELAAKEPADRRVAVAFAELAVAI
jgi:hypothetical protein